MERIVQVGAAELCVETFGDRGGEPVLLVAGTSCSMDWWPATLCRGLADQGLLVIRFDQRDTGRSSYDPPGRPSYSLPDLVSDSVGLLDLLDLDSAHWVGFSQGGWIAQLAALDHAARVRSLALLSTRATGHGPADPDLPEVSSDLLEAWSAAPAEPDWADADAVIRFLVDGERSIAGDEFDERHALRIAEDCVRRAHQVRSAIANHPMADQGPRWRHRLGAISAPSLILHGTKDPMFPVGNAAALEREIPGARLERLAGVGHEIPPRVWHRVTELITRHVHDASVGR
ncbi:alpha/beta hydrolase [Microbacterium sp.]|uniref:alpha/beta fold hydrolase n=1 Tax=Microbacterium sp. TaxID=51671 RepID=UPI002810A2C0|nr:alpha/beta hydrolase [Microbacterium sp.]